ncbi:MAG: hypothetical protein KDA84_05245, partial [Planctomycetaceae bacterium]|nr:hypothetical protein [Planctomycetaceae bacterium]
ELPTIAGAEKGIVGIFHGFILRWNGKLQTKCPIISKYVCNITPKRGLNEVRIVVRPIEKTDKRTR